MARAGATNITLVTLLVPVFAVASAALTLGERLRPAEAAGMALIGLSLVVIDGRWLARLRRSSERS